MAHIVGRQADAAILAASIAHEINQPLAAIAFNGAAGMRWLSGEIPNVERAKGTFKNIMDAEQRAVEIIDSELSLLPATPRELAYYS
jgi:C4-dicarboxylate-specific signal transduction histidine kinase